MASVHLHGVWKLYGSTKAVIDLDLLCRSGEMLALLGPSGCGKSSTLKMIAGIETVTRGEILFDDRTVTRLDASQRNLAMVFEDYALYPHLSVSENIAFPLTVRKLPAAEIAERVQRALDLLGLAEWRDRGIRGLSGGAQQRVSIGRALVRRPELVLFDEPLSHLDADQKVHLRTEIKRLQRKTGLTSILVTHDQVEAMAMADLVAVMDGGVLQQAATPDELYERPANLFVANFIGEPPMNLLAAEAVADGSSVLLHGAGWRMTLGGEEAMRLRRVMAGTRLTLGIRPEHLGIERTRSPASVGSGEVFDVEPRGEMDVVQVEVADEDARSRTRLVAEAPAADLLRAGEPVFLRFAPERLYFFDTPSGRNLFSSEAR